MQYQFLATDYDGTLARDGLVDQDTLLAVQRLKETGRKVILVTGRQMPDLISTFPDYQICDVIIAENGGVVHWPSENREDVLGEGLPEAFVAEVVKRGVIPFSKGKVIFATWHPHEHVLLEVIQQLGLESHIIFNKGAVMVLPSGINKATGLAKALQTLNTSFEHVVGIGDAENDHAFLDACCVSVAVDNALPAVKARCDLVMAQYWGGGVAELIDQMILNDLNHLGTRRPRHEMLAK